jgi:signal transduction histidine kinase
VALALVRRRPESQATAEHLDRIERETERLNVLIGQLLVMARLDSGVDLERKAVFDLGLLVDEVAADADYEARGRQCAVQFTQPFQCRVEGARETLRGAVENVVRNGVRHTAAGTSVEIVMSCPQTEHDSRVVVQVRDHGPGVQEGALAELFTPFHHIESGWRGGDRTGLGLAITKRTLEIHGGTVRAANAPGGGLIVTLELPLIGAVPIASTETEGDLEGQRDNRRVAVERRNTLRAV